MGERRTAVEATLVAAALAAAYLIAQPITADLASQTYRTGLFERLGFTPWDGQWFAGHHVLGYSILFPPLAAAVGTRVAGALAAVAAAPLFDRLARPYLGERARLGAMWFAAATATNLFTGRLTFALGVAIGLAALLAARHERRALAVALAALCSLGSPVAGLFLALAGIAWFWAERRGVGLAVAGGALAAAVAMSVLFPEGGTEPFAFSSFWPLLAYAAVVLALVPARERWLRRGALLYAAAGTLAYLVDTPMGSNAVRLGTLFGGPLLACALWPRRRWALALLAAPLVYWQWQPPVRDLSAATDDPSVHAAYYAPLNAFLARAHVTGRVEVPVTRNHWESVHVARRFPIARGWERQLDVKYDGLFYERTLPPARYRRWLLANAVEYVALPDTKLDYSADDEAALIRRGLPYLQPAWSSRHWRVYRLRGAAPLASGPGRLIALTPNSFSLAASRAGTFDVRVRWTRYWTVARGAACLRPGPDGFTRVAAKRPGRVRVSAELTVRGLLGETPACR
jgi:hypothetical protein